MLHRTTGSRTAIAALAVAVGLLSMLPFGYLLLAGVSPAAITDLFSYATTIPTIVRTVGLTGLVAALTALLGVGCALLVVRTDAPLRRLLTVLFAMPLAVPGFVSSYAVYSASLLYAPRSSVVTSFPGAALVLALSLYPYVFLPAVVALRGIDPDQEEVAASLQRRPWAPLTRVVLPQLRPAVAAGTLIVALHVLAEYGAVVQLGQRTLTTTIMTEILAYGNYESARSLALLLGGLSVIVLLANRWFAGPGWPIHTGAGGVRPPTRYALRGWRIPALAVALLVPAAALGPTIHMTIRGLTNTSRGAIVRWPEVFQALGSTAAYATSAALLATLAALPVSWWVSRHPTATAQLTERTVWVAHSIPNAILALALVFLATRLVPALYKTPFLLVIAYVILYLPLAVANQRVGLRAALPRYDEVAASLGSRSWRVFSRVTLPLALPGFAAGALFVGLDASKELTTTLMLLPFNSHTLATGLWATTNGETLDFTAAAPYALMLVLLGSIPVHLIVRRTLRHVD